ncbi:lysophospholipid acyltransferase family protein [Mangrovivirga sp. M17]|uniref:Lysophospholipid acyltransferase family protein n=1 Tax=Mangrovivirga halotolerans TaxID=2993936 RepID=A0ABT3RMY1_9BACT|nr:lysophospholipid acyltransferase family protein [Mangrovivirga halotolerans]MCX2742525.1 lysophospholipid acyltransferase family protein [Mangrovivirga halotolerans]
MKIILGNILYYPLKIWVRIACNFYFSEFKIKGLEKIPSDGPIIIAGNHQNALLDAMILSVISPRNPHFLTRASVFKNKLIASVLKSLKMIPVFRFRDGIGSVRKNSQSFESAHKVLEKNQTLGIFPEGNHDLKYRLRPLQKGIARIAFETEKRNNYNKGVKIIPVGIHYEDHFESRSRVLVNIGTPLEVKDHIPNYNQNERLGYDSLLEDLSSKMKELIFNFDSPSNYESMISLFNKKRLKISNVANQFETDIKLIKKLKKESHHPENEEFIKWYAPTGKLKSIIYFLSDIIFYIPRKLINKLILNKVNDKHFYATASFTSKIFIYPIFIILVYLILNSSVDFI